MKKSRITLRWAGLKVQNGSKNLAIVHGWCWKENANKEKRQMKNNNNNKMKINITKTSRGSTKQVPSLGVLAFLIIILWLLVIIKWLFMIVLWLLIIICNYKNDYLWFFVVILLWHVSVIYTNAVGSTFLFSCDY